MEQSIVDRIKQLEDVQAIQQLFNEYALYLDTGQFDRYASLFSEEGEVKLGPMGRAKGPAAIQALMEKNLAAHVGRSYHIISNPIISVTGDTAVSQVMWTVIMRTGDDKPELGMVGQHRDELIRENGEWRFLSRAGFVDIPRAMVQSDS